MNDKTNFAGYSQVVGISSGNSTTLTTNCNGTVNTYSDGNWATPLNEGNIYTSPGVPIRDYSISTSITNSLTINQNNMVKQVKAAVFTVERNEDNKVVSAKLLKELWVEIKNGSSLELAVAKELDKDFDPSTTVVREIYSVTF